jgi:acyl-CoA thioester hydrolase
MPDGTRRAPHVFSLRVYYEDTDAGGMVYYANYLRFAERARTEMLRQAGIGQQAMLEGEGLGFIVRRCTIEYLKPARLDDLLDVHTTLVEARGARLAVAQRISRADEDLARFALEIACVDRAGRPRRLPKALLSAFAAAISPSS